MTTEDQQARLGYFRVCNAQKKIGMKAAPSPYMIKVKSFLS